ncbi:ABC transporter permease subunit [Nocardioides sp. ChNu-153]|uniref:ABC transporter permease n=1 Tax=unclassified Nocardioides TaxID=2615069 RepID=UPI002405BC96|nr:MULTISPECIES: ABC transporter permease subunit [unclassified Nocardioides]MDF9714580.1 ABC transporter permease subunit [Nocardioides sp. ChNu-99]MDN7119887.1 ABC transporter permease subunit [Nocardioides sp. ChNu-153]
MSLLLEALRWLGEADHWSGEGGVTARLLQHLAVSALVVGIAAAVALPLGVLVGHTGRGRGLVVVTASAARAVPTLGLLTLVALASGIGLTAPVLALVVLAAPPLLAGAYAGVESVDRVTVDAARAVGMSEAQVVRRVELPLAAPLVVGGLRSATLQVVATATLAAYTADVGLGRLLFAGLKARRYDEMLAAALLVAALALVLELLLAGLQRLVSPAGVRTAGARRRTVTGTTVARGKPGEPPAPKHDVTAPPVERTP